VSPAKYELGFYIPEEAFFIVTAVKTSNLTLVGKSHRRPNRGFNTATVDGCCRKLAGYMNWVWVS
jgi:hypothetical protein